MRNLRKIRVHSKQYYSLNQESKKAASRASYRANPDKKRAASRAASRASYRTNPDKKRAASRASYVANPDKKNSGFMRFYAKHREERCDSRRGRYALAEPKPAAKEFYVKEMQRHLLNDSGARNELMEAFRRQYKSTANRKVMIKAVCRIAAKRLLNKALQLRKEHAGALFKTTRAVNSLNIKGRDDFGEECHTASSEPYFYDSAYQPVQRAYAIPIDENGSCVVASEIGSSEHESSKGKGKQQPMKWSCCSECKAVTEPEVAAIVHLKQAFDEPMQELRNALGACDGGCPNQHYTTVVPSGDPDSKVVELQSHPLVCFNDGGCCSQLRILRAASTHYSVLRTLLNHVHSAIRSHLVVLNIDKALHAGDLHSLMEVTKVRDFATLLTNDLDSSYEQCCLLLVLTHSLRMSSLSY